ncbi:MAG: Serine-protein kinase RsbW [candidate division WS2 bacterium]|nr:Serine-protein kinase RsbW [Candidatus Lithacetigena glycinireducens]MBT9174552.1 Serine-protein kinase RsbW [Candidatus Lithacetigena glycinireducens]
MSKAFLILPVEESFLTQLRLFVSGAATQAGLGFEEVEDLKFTVAELMGCLLNTEVRRGTIKISYEMEDEVFYLLMEIPRRYSCFLDQDITNILLNCLTDNVERTNTRRGVMVRIVKHAASSR